MCSTMRLRTMSLFTKSDLSKKRSNWGNAREVLLFVRLECVKDSSSSVDSATTNCVGKFKSTD